ncbi:hypothetical protein Srufu_068220 [Streptomyces libani subsp. rufus]|nr:hypothetical protein Srufu_068220 [Streptomyces libani subsp. rufus]
MQAGPPVSLAGAPAGQVVCGPGHGITPVDPVPRTLLWGTPPGRVRFGEIRRGISFGR